MKSHNQIIFGKHPVLEAINNGESIEKVLLVQGTRGELEIQLRQSCRARNIPISMAPKEKLDAIAKGKNHQSVLAFMSPIQFYEIEDIIPHIYEKGETPLILILDGVTDTRNFGAIVRSAEIFGAHAIIVPLKGSAQIGSDALKTSAGALLKVPICKTKSLVNVVEYLRDSGLQVFSSDLNATNPIFQLDFAVPMALIIGSEDQGVSHALLKRSNHTFLIPQIGEIDSLNVAVSTGVMLYEVLRQRKLEV